MRTIQAFYFNGKRYECNKNGRPDTGVKRASPRRLIGNEMELEKKFLEVFRTKKFNEDFCQANKWLSTAFSERVLKYEKVRAITEMFAFLLNKPMFREIYRRRVCCLYWIEENLEEIFQFLTDNELIVLYNSKKIMRLRPPINSGIPKKQDDTYTESPLCLENNLLHFENNDEFNYEMLEAKIIDNGHYPIDEKFDVFSSFLLI
jgi:hypothetical protein